MNGRHQSSFPGGQGRYPLFPHLHRGDPLNEEPYYDPYLDHRFGLGLGAGGLFDHRRPGYEALYNPALTSIDDGTGSEDFAAVDDVTGAIDGFEIPFNDVTSDPEITEEVQEISNETKVDSPQLEQQDKISEIYKLLEESNQLVVEVSRLQEKHKDRRSRHSTSEQLENKGRLKCLSKRHKSFQKSIDALYGVLNKFMAIQGNLLHAVLKQRAQDNTAFIEYPDLDSSISTSDEETTSSKMTVMRTKEAASILPNDDLPRGPEGAVLRRVSHQEKKYHSFLKSKNTPIKEDNRLAFQFRSSEKPMRNNTGQLVNSNIVIPSANGSDTGKKSKTYSGFHPATVGPAARRESHDLDPERDRGTPLVQSDSRSDALKKLHGISGSGQRGRRPVVPSGSVGGKERSAAFQHDDSRSRQDGKCTRNKGRETRTGRLDNGGRYKTSEGFLRSKARSLHPGTRHFTVVGQDNSSPARSPTGSADRQMSSVRPNSDGRESSARRRSPVSRGDSKLLPSTNGQPGVQHKARSSDDIMGSKTTGTDTLVKAASNRLEVQPPTKKIILSIVWTDMANRALREAKALKEEDDRKVGISTCLCLDISESMRGEPWKALKDFVTRYLKYVDFEARHFDRHERVAMVIFGHDTRVVHYFTREYQELQQSLDNLTPGGPSPLYGGLTLSLGVCMGGGKQVVIRNLKIHERVILVTDGRVTMTEMIAGPDVVDTKEILRSQTEVIHRAQMMSGTHGYTIDVVPVGDSDQEFLEKITYTSEGRMLATEAQQIQMFKRFRNCRSAAVYTDGFERLIVGSWRLRDIRLRNPDVTDADVDEIGEITDKYNSEIEQNFTDEMLKNREIIPGVPVIGTRVRRGPEWYPHNSCDGNGHGTVIGQRHERVHVAWDTGTMSFHEYGFKGRYEVVVVDEPRVLTKDEQIGIGCVVNRGQDWDFLDLNGGPGQPGVVYRQKTCGLIKVLWPNGEFRYYPYGYDGIFALEICEGEQVRSAVLSQRTALEQPIESTAYTLPETPLGGPTDTPGSQSIRPDVSISSSSDSLLIPYGDSNSQRAISPRPSPTPEKKSPVGNTQAQQEETIRRLNERNAVSSSKSNQQTSKSVTKKQSDASGNPVQEARTGKRHQASASLGDSLSSSSRLKQVSVSQTHKDEAEFQLKRRGFCWQYQDKSGVWMTYPSNACDLIETVFRSRQPSTCIVNIDYQPYRVIPSKMEQIHLPTKTISPIQRVTQGQGQAN